MEVYDFEDDHLVAVLPNDRQDSEEDQAACHSSKEPIHEFLSPTEQERISERDSFAKEQHLESSTCHDSDSNRLASMNTVAKSAATQPISVEMDRSSERYQHLPAYAQVTFVEAKKEDLDPLLPVKDLPSTILVPSDARLHAILRKTAESVVQSPQLEVLIKVKQADNPDLAFLHPFHEHFAYYEWWKAKVRDEKIRRKDSAERGNVYDLLGVYSSSSDEEVDDSRGSDRILEPMTTSNEQVLVPPGSQKRAGSSAPDVNVNARRLERAKMLQEHFQSKMM
jgi:hypothetical protein